MCVLRFKFAVISFFCCLLPFSTQGLSQETTVVLDRIIAVVDKDVILQSELDAFINNIKQQLIAKNTKLPSVQVLQKQALDRLILNKIQVQLALSTGIRVDDETLNRSIEKIAHQNGLQIDQFRTILQQDGIDFSTFREDIREEIIISRLQRRNVTNQINITDQEITEATDNRGRLSLNDQSYHLGHILIAVPDAATPDQIQSARSKAQKVLDEIRSGADFSQKAVAVSEGQQALKGGDLGWFPAAQVPSLFVDVVQRLQPGDVSELIRNASGFHIVKVIETRGETKKHFIQQTQARHILVKTNAVVSNEDARQQLEDLISQIENGKSFEELARIHSADTLSARDGGSLGWVDPGTMVSQFESVMNSLEPGMISAPFQTRFGWHIVQVMGRRDRDVTQNVKRSKIVEQIRNRKHQEALELWLRRLRDEAYVEIRVDV